jgi:ubiquinone/menaquinone biosynthesis C-methylase UbiE
MTDRSNPEKLQREYYERTAANYERAHVAVEDEHGVALSFLEGLAAGKAHASFLDVGAGTGRAMRRLKKTFPHSRVVGVEPVAALRAVACEQGLAANDIEDGDATALRFDDDSIDWVVETGVLHHVRDWRQAVSEMCRVARTGVLISDSNNVGQGRWLARQAKAGLRALGLWQGVIAVQTRGKMYKYSEGDGIYFSFCAFDCVPLLRTKFPNVHYINTVPAGPDLLRSAGHVAIIAWR